MTDDTAIAAAGGRVNRVTSATSDCSILGGKAEESLLSPRSLVGVKKRCEGEKRCKLQ